MVAEGQPVTAQRPYGLTAAEHLEAAILLLRVEHGLPVGVCDLRIEVAENGRVRRATAEHWRWHQRLVFGRNDLSRPGEIAA